MTNTLYKDSHAFGIQTESAPDARTHIENRGNRVIVLGHTSSWPAVFASHADVFGTSSL